MFDKIMEIIISNQERPYPYTEKVSYFFNKIDELCFSEHEKKFILKIIIEVLRNSSAELNEPLTNIRKEIWVGTFGVPTLDFILINKELIDQVVNMLILTSVSAPELLEYIISNTPVLMRHIEKSIEDNSLYEQYSAPLPDSSDSFIATANKQGFMTTKAIDPFSTQFIDKAKQSSETGGMVLEIGAAYGVATLKALDTGATVVCNDLEPIHLAVVVKEHMKRKHGILIPVAGSFPDELSFKNHEFDAILISRVLHFFDGEQIIDSLKKARQWLKPGGSLFVVNETPYLSNWSSFLDEYRERKTRGDKWPGLINNTQLYEQSRSLSLPKLVHWLDEDTLRQALYESGFNEEEVQISYIDRSGQFPPDMLMEHEHRESVGCQAIKLG